MNSSKKNVHFDNYKLLSFVFVLVIHIILISIASQQPDSDNASRKREKINISFSKINTKVKSLTKKQIKKRSQLKKISQRIKKLDHHIAPSMHYSPPSFAQSSLSSEIHSQINLEVPQVSGSSEKVHAELEGFFKRVSNRYLNSLRDTYFSQKLISSNFDIPLDRIPDEVSYRVTYDKMGNIIKVKTTRAGKKSIYTKFLEKSVKDIDLIPNPPQLLLNRSEEFSINFKLTINQ